MRIFSALLQLVLCFLFSNYATSTLAQPAGAKDDYFIYFVEAGDTLSELSELYTTRSSHWRHLQQLNQVEDEMRLPIGKELKIPFDLIPVIATEATLVHYKGDVKINHQSATKHTRLKAGDIINTGSRGFATLQLEDGSTLTLPPQSQLYLKQLNAFERARISDAILELQQGSIESHVAPNNTGVGRFEIHTPISITGIRGTNLRVHTTEARTQTELLSGKAHIDRPEQRFQMLSNGYGANISADGKTAITALLPAPQLTLPKRGPKGWQTELIPVSGAQAYLVQVALSENGSQAVQRFTVPADQNIVYLRPSGPGEHYAFVRAIDEHGLMGLDAMVSYPGQGVLISTDGSPVVSGDGQPILLTDY